MALTIFIVDIKQSMETSVDNWKTNNDLIQLKQKVRETVQFHADAKQLSHENQSNFTQRKIHKRIFLPVI